MTHRFTYSPGAATAVCVGDWAVLIGLAPTHQAAARLYGLLLGSPSMGQVTDLLAETYGDYSDVVVIHAVDPVHTFLWGSVGAETTTGRGTARRCAASRRSRDRRCWAGT